MEKGGYNVGVGTAGVINRLACPPRRSFDSLRVAGRQLPPGVTCDGKPLRIQA